MDYYKLKNLRVGDVFYFKCENATILYRRTSHKIIKHIPSGFPHEVCSYADHDVVLIESTKEEVKEKPSPIPDTIERFLALIKA